MCVQIQMTADTDLFSRISRTTTSLGQAWIDLDADQNRNNLSEVDHVKKGVNSSQGWTHNIDMHGWLIIFLPFLSEVAFIT